MNAKGRHCTLSIPNPLHSKIQSAVTVCLLEPVTSLIALIGGRHTAPNGLYLPPQADQRIKQLEEKLERLEAREVLGVLSSRVGGPLVGRVVPSMVCT